MYLISSGPYVVSDIIKKGLVTLKNKNCKELKKVYQGAIEFLFRDLDGINKHQDFPEDEIHQSGDDCIENLIHDVLQNNQPLNEKPVQNSQNSQISDETPVIVINGWNKFGKSIDIGY